MVPSARRTSRRDAWRPFSMLRFMTTTILLAPACDQVTECFLAHLAGPADHDPLAGKRVSKTSGNDFSDRDAREHSRDAGESPFRFAPAWRRFVCRLKNGMGQRPGRALLTCQKRS